MFRTFAALAAAAACLVGGAAQAAQGSEPPHQEGDYVIPFFKFGTGEVMEKLRMHYTTLGTPIRDKAGHVTNAVMVLHGTGGDGHQFFRPQFANVLMVPGGVLDPAKYFIILPDGIGHGKSSKPSDGLRTRFPRYDYDDMVEAEYRLVAEGLKVDHLRLVMGTSMGCMHAFVLGESHPDFMDALMPMACQPTALAGRNRLWRKFLIDAILADPDWNEGNYQTQPQGALREAAALLSIAGSAPIQMQKSMPTRAEVDAYAEEYVADELTSLDANDLLYQVSASRNYDPSAGLSKITAKVMWVNSADDFINPPSLGLAEKFAPMIRNGRYVLIPESEMTHGHGSHTWAVLWQDKLKALLDATAPPPPPPVKPKPVKRKVRVHREAPESPDAGH
ncbi:alpha/beta fold hydrolase [Phenylobacterium aquaticum]|uniref:alpha/beta fold hydrolase n=1 Tax=Phenylobacterium aquaticum TaxID=1763816 RepID=UPI001F5CD784|nr:alpha/beta fold hydrolase [Phenylobacterium aquaticum]MCI3134796.1 alpha/beta fold hydrolase [Phenylobacterium aquaticum]